MPELPTVQLKYLSHHPAIWPKMIGKASPTARPGDLVRVLAKDGSTFGTGFWNPQARLPLRMVHHGDEEVDEAYFDEAIRRAATLRRGLLQLDDDSETYRAVHADADRLPGLVADRFGEVLSLEVTTLAAWQRLDRWLPLLHEGFGTTRAHIRVDPELARVECISAGTHPASDDTLRRTKVREHGVTYEVDFAAGHKTGFFCDQRDNRRRFGQLARGREVLDLCCYTGGFAVNAALAGAAEVTAVDLDEKAVAMARRNANLNDCRIKLTHADAFTWIRTMIANGRQWDLVMADPPKFIFSRDDEAGRAKYHDLNKLALQLVRPGGIYVTCSCSGRLSADEFERIVTRVAHRQDKPLQILDRTGAGADHPTLSTYPESRYLKVIWSRVP